MLQTIDGNVSETIDGSIQALRLKTSTQESSATEQRGIS